MTMSEISSVKDYLLEVEQREAVLKTMLPLLGNKRRKTPNLSIELSNERQKKRKQRVPIFAGPCFCQRISEAQAHNSDLDASYDYAKLKSMSVPGAKALAELDAERAESFQSIVDIESAVANQSKRKTYNNAVILQAVYIEGLFDFLLRGTSDIADAILEHLKSAQSHIVERAYSDGRQTMGSLQLVCIGLHRAVRAESESALGWIEESFFPVVSRHTNEQESIFDRLSTGNLARTIGRLREQYRNPLIHPNPEVVIGSEEYKLFCDLAYATRNLQQWMDLGVNPAYYSHASLGWVSFLVSAMKQVNHCDVVLPNSSE